MDVIDREKKWLLEEKYAGFPSEDYHRDVSRLHRDVPLAYIIGYVHFLNCHIDVSQRPFIPRVETEFWVEKVIGALKDTHPSQKSTRILDLCAGSGCIGIAFLKHLSNALVDFGEMNISFIKQIVMNGEKNHIDARRMRTIHTDLFSNINDRYDVIVTNPPYLSRTRQSFTQKSVLEFEPHDALFSRDNGFAHIKNIIVTAPLHLHDRGKLYVEIDPWQKTIIEDLFQESNEYSKIMFLKDQYGVFRVAAFEK
jgi:release factor glutamine methyltransferase